jgi:hypothetical protein
MKTILRILSDIALLPITGCIVSGNRIYGEDRDRPKSLANRIKSTKVNQANPGR